VVKELERQSAGKQAGLTFYSLDDPARLAEVLRTQKYDLLLVDAGDADNLERQALSVPSRPVVLPVLYQSGKAAAAEAEKKFHCVLTAPNSPGRYLSAIDRAMEFKRNTRSRTGLP
jgi:DNA-binding NtrC family response regulator